MQSDLGFKIRLDLPFLAISYSDKLIHRIILQPIKKLNIILHKSVSLHLGFESLWCGIRDAETADFCMHR